MLCQGRRNGFTLVEILIVVIILGILAAIVIPQFANASTDARKAALSDQLHNIRVQIQLYTLQHGDIRPDLNGSNWDALVKVNAFQGKDYGPYLPSVPRNVLNNYSDVLQVADDPTWGDAISGTDIGFVYNPVTGFIWGTNRSANKIYNEENPQSADNN